MEDYNIFGRRSSSSSREVFILGGNGNLVSKHLSSSFPDHADVHWIGSEDIESFCVFLSKAANIRSLYVENVGAGSESFDASFGPLSMKSLKTLMIQNVSPDFKVLQILSTKVVMENLQILSLDASSIDGAEIYAAKIINSCKQSLTKALFPGYRWQSSFLENTESNFPNVQEIYLDVTDYTESSGSHIPYNICARFPRLEKFTSKLGSFPIEDISNLASCRKLKSVEIGIYVTRQKTVADLRFLTQMYALKNVHIRIYFNSTPRGKYCEILNEEQLQTKFRNNLQIQKRC